MDARGPIATALVARAQFYDLTGAPTAATGTPVLTAVDSFTGAVIAPGAVTQNGTIYSATLPAQAAPSRATLTWTATVSGEAVVRTAEAQWCGGAGTYPELGESVYLEAGLAGTDEVNLRELQIEVQDSVEDVTGVPWVIRTYQDTVSGDGVRNWVLLDQKFVRSVESVTVGGTALTTGTYVADDIGKLTLTDGSCFPAGTHNIVVRYTAGKDRPPVELARPMAAHMLWLRNYARRAAPEEAFSRIANPRDQGNEAPSGSIPHRILMAYQEFDFDNRRRGVG